MKTIKFKCTLLSDIILSESTATEGVQKTLDYIPGSVFLGIVAGKLYPQISYEEAMDLFHNAKVCFGDAHPLLNNTRSIRTPASWCVKKGEKINSNIYVHHELPTIGLLDEYEYFQPVKYMREGFIVCSDSQYFESLSPDRNFAIKSAYDKNLRKSKDKNMYGYQSLQSGMELGFQIDFDDSVSNLIPNVVSSLDGITTIGKSRTAQYGQIKIEESDHSIGFKEDQKVCSGYTFLFADSRLSFLGQFGQPTATPNSEQFGLKDAKVDLSMSQINTFRYSPYNSKRKTRDTERFVIEKGSVICIKKTIEKDEAEKIRTGIGLFQNEGFGKVLINPDFLKTKENAKNGEALFQHIKTNLENKSQLQKEVPTQINNPQSLEENSVLAYLIRSQKKKKKEHLIYKNVNDFVEKHKSLFQNESEQYASQWGTIRTKAIQANSKTELRNALFLKARNDEESKRIKQGYLVSGQASSKWEDKQQLKVLKDFFNKLDDEIAIATMINLSAEMAKICKKKGGRK